MTVLKPISRTPPSHPSTESQTTTFLKDGRCRPGTRCACTGSNTHDPPSSTHCFNDAPAAGPGSAPESASMGRLGRIPCVAAGSHTALDTGKRTRAHFVVQVLHCLLLRLLGHGAAFHIARESSLGSLHHSPVTRGKYF